MSCEHCADAYLEGWRDAAVKFGAVVNAARAFAHEIDTVGLGLVALQQHGSGVFIDFESRGPAVAERMRPLGVDVARVTYIRPLEALQHGPRQQALYGALEALHGPTLVIIDGFNTFLEYQGVDYTSTTEVTAVYKTWLEPIADMGHGVVLIDHVAKNAQGKLTAIGSQAKKAVITGTSLAMTVVEPFGRGKRGVANVQVLKDKDGHVDALIEEGDAAKNVARLVLDAKHAHSYVVEVQGNDWASREMRHQDATTYIQAMDGWEDMTSNAIAARVLDAGYPVRRQELLRLIKDLRTGGGSGSHIGSE